MPLAIYDYTCGDKTDEEVLRIVVEAYANPDNWASYEKDCGTGRPIMCEPWIYRDRGLYAAAALKYLSERKKP